MIHEKVKNHPLEKLKIKNDWITQLALGWHVSTAMKIITFRQSFISEFGWTGYVYCNYRKGLVITWPVFMPSSNVVIVKWQLGCCKVYGYTDSLRFLTWQLQSYGKLAETDTILSWCWRDTMLCCSVKYGMLISAIFMNWFHSFAHFHP